MYFKYKIQKMYFKYLYLKYYPALFTVKVPFLMPNQQHHNTEGSI